MAFMQNNINTLKSISNGMTFFYLMIQNFLPVLLEWVYQIKLLNAISVSSASKNKTHELIKCCYLSLTLYFSFYSSGNVEVLFKKTNSLPITSNEKLYLLNSLFLAKMRTSMSVYCTRHNSK